MKLDDQIEALNQLFRSNGVLFVAAFIVTLLATTPDQVNNPLTGMFLGSMYLTSITLMGIFTYQLLSGLNFSLSKGQVWRSLRNMNWLLYVVFHLFLLLSFSLVFEFGSRYLNAVAMATGMFVAFLVYPFIIIAFVGLPIIVARTVYEKASAEKTIRDKLILYTPTVVVMFLIPLAAYLVRRQWNDLLILPIFAVLIAGAVLFFLAVEDILKSRRKKK